MADHQPAEWANLADATITCSQGQEKPVIPCHSAVLARHSGILAGMFSSTDAAGWADGLQALFAGYSVDSVKVFVAYTHACYPGAMEIKELRRRLGMAEEAPWDAIVDLARLAHKLDSGSFSEVSEGFTGV